MNLEEKIIDMLLPYKNMLIDNDNKLTILGCLVFTHVGIIIYKLMLEEKKKDEKK